MLAFKILRKASTHFGFKEIDISQKQDKVNQVFEKVANKYDIMNDAMSLFQHRLWKNCFVDKLSPCHNKVYLDLAGGTGDIAFRIADRMAISWKCTGNNDKFQFGKDGRLIVSDISSDMLRVGKLRAEQLRIVGIEWLEADAALLPIESESIDAITISFGLRNCPEPPKVLEEAYRVLKKGGKFMCLEFSKVENPLLASIYDYYSLKVIPVMGMVIAGDWNSYQYLVESIRMFYTKEQLLELFNEYKFVANTIDQLYGGIVCIHTGWKY